MHTGANRSDTFRRGHVGARGARQSQGHVPAKCAHRRPADRGDLGPQGEGRARSRVRELFFSYVGPRHGTALAIRADRLAPRSRRLQEAMLQYKTKAQIMYLLEPRDLTEKQNSSLDADEAEFFRGS